MKLLRNTSQLLALILIAACRKTSEVPAATLQIMTPVNQQTFAKGDTVQISAYASYVAEMHGYRALIVSASGDTLLDADEHIHGTTVNISENWVNNSLTAQELKVIVGVEIDHDGHEMSREVIIHTQP